MKTLFLSLTLFCSISSFAAITVVSDLDDTIKITNAGEIAQAAYNGIFTTGTYSGMPSFLKEVRSYTNKLHVVTGSPTFLRGRIFELFKKNKISVDSLNLKNPLLHEDTQAYKTRVISAIIESSSDDIILIGDDVDKDHLIYDGLKSRYPNRIIAIYIHAIRNHRSLPSSVVRYWTSFDLTLHEVISNRMNPSYVPVAAQLLIQESKQKNIFPDFANCPKQASTWEWQIQTVFSSEALAVSRKLVDYCTTRTFTKVAESIN